MTLTRPRRRNASLASALFVLLALSSALAGGGDNDAASVWRPITPAELQMNAPTVEPDADAEAIFWEVRLDDKKSNKLSYEHYVRVKIFTERGRERFAKMDIPFMKGKKVENVAARVIKPDGTVIELKPTDIFEREIAKAGKQRVLAKSFAVPGIEPGVIVEYRYSETFKGESAGGERLIFQRDIPMQRVSYYVRPHSSGVLNFNSYNMQETRFVENGDGFRVATMTNVPALKEEPYMPPDDEVKRWVFLSYSNLGSLLQWGFLSQRWELTLAKFAKPTKEIKAKAAELTAGAASDDEKVRRIYDFVQKRVRNITYDKNLTEEQIEDLDVKDADDALKRGMGNSFHLDLLFAALTKAVGLETNVVVAGDRSDNFFTPEKYPFTGFIQMSGIAVKIGTEWKYFDPCQPYMPYGMLPWNREDVRAMLIGDGGNLWKTIPAVDISKSRAKRTGTLKLSADGTLEGDVTFEYEGHQAISRRRDQIKDSPAKREENFRDEIKKKISTAEITALSVENFEDSTKPLTYRMKIRVPNYAQRVGKRLILQPGFFEYGSQPVFISATRTYNMYFPYPWSEEDSLEIKFPADFELDGADSPALVSDPSKIGVDKISISVEKASNILRYNRNFHFGANGKILFPVAVYKPMKNLFDAFHKADTHAISLKQKVQQP
jgi:hypothetical protein